VTPPGIDPWTVRLVAQCLNHYATPGPQMFLLVVKIVHLIGRTDLFKISNLVLVGQAIVTSLYNSLEGTERERERDQ